MPPTAPTPAPTPAPPQTLILNYLTSSGSPTRIRNVAAMALLIIGLLSVVIGLFMAADLAHYLYRAYQAGLMPGRRWVRPPPPLYQYLVWYVRGRPLATILAPSLLICGTMQLFLALPVRRGNRKACNLALAAHIPILLIALVATAIIGGTGLIYALGIYGKPEPRYFLWLLYLIPGILLILILKDLCTYLRWIAHNPREDKPRTSFFPSSTSKLQENPPSPQGGDNGHGIPTDVTK